MMKVLGRIFDTRLTRAAGIVFVLIVALVIFNVYSDLPEDHPGFGVILFSAVPILFIVGGTIFVLAILRGAAAFRPKLIFLMSAGALGIIFLFLGAYQLVDFTDSTGFCGRLCHAVMYPEYTAYQASPHSRVACTDCHVGPGASYLAKSKISGLPLIYDTITSSYPQPIKAPVHSLRPARATCEQCHRPERFTGDLVVDHVTYAPDQNNTRFSDTLVLRIGGGQSGVAKDIHWHIAATVHYLPLDKTRQDIAWVSVDSEEGTINYIDPDQADQVTTKRIEDDQRHMDCIDCHNRATHQFKSPETLLDEAFVQGRLDISLPYLKQQAILALDPTNKSLDQAYAKAESISDFYRENYPDVYQQKQGSIDSSIETIKGIAKLTTFPHMMVTWETYVDNIGHQDSPGCFRCHGKLVAQNGPTKGQTISSDCTLCHYSSVP